MGLISTIQNKTEQARAKERIKPLLESRMMRDILLEVGQRGTEKLDPQSVPLEQRPGPAVHQVAKKEQTKPRIMRLR